MQFQTAFNLNMDIRLLCSLKVLHLFMSSVVQAWGYIAQHSLSPLLFPSFLFLPTSKFISFFMENNLTLRYLFSIYAFKALHSLLHHPCLIKLFPQYSSLEEIYFHLENKFFFFHFATSITHTRSKEGREGGNSTSASQ